VHEGRQPLVAACSALWLLGTTRILCAETPRMQIVTSTRSLSLILVVLALSTIALARTAPATTPASSFELACHGATSPIIYCQAGNCGCSPVSTISVASDIGCERGCFVAGSLTCGQVVAPAPVFMSCGTRDSIGIDCGVPFGCDHGNIYVVLLCSSCMDD
jgi:hypothetical protein